VSMPRQSEWTRRTVLRIAWGGIFGQGPALISDLEEGHYFND